jgi:hypothetical protein
VKVPVDLVVFFLSYLCVCTVCPFHRNCLFPSFNVNINFLSKNTSNNLEIVLVAVKWVEWYVRKASSFHIRVCFTFNCMIWNELAFLTYHSTHFTATRTISKLLDVFFDKKLILTLKEGKRQFQS